jgi:tetratricopeptide (TPR) repeat protein
MSQLAYEFRTLPSEYQQLLSLTQQTHSIRITPLQQLSGGKSGALLYLVSILARGSQQAEHCILKLDHPKNNNGNVNSEVDQHLIAVTEAPEEFALQHMARFAFSPVEYEGRIAIIYTIAGYSLQRCRPVTSYIRQVQQEVIFKTIGNALTSQWQKEITFETAHPQELLKKWLGYRLSDEEGHISSFLRDTCHIWPEIKGVLIEGHLLPNPFTYARARDTWGDVRLIDTAVGFIHGDLNTNNVLIEYSLDGEKLENFYFIDFASFEENTYLFYDHLYFEFSYLLQQANRTSYTSWINLVNLLAEKDMPNPIQAPADLLGPCSTIVQLRIAFEQWVNTNHKALSDDLWGQFRLAAVAVGLNFCNKRSLSPFERKAAYAYAAFHLNSYFVRFNALPPNEAKEFPLTEEEQTVDVGINWEPFLQASQGFNNERLYLLVVGPQTRHMPILSALAKANWNVVLDFDPNTSEDGLYSLMSDAIKERRSLHLLTSEDRISLNLGNTTYWYAARGLTGRTSTLLPDNTWQRWNRKYFDLLRSLLIDIAAISEELPITAIITWDETLYISDVCMLIDQAFAERVEFVFASSNNNLSSISYKYENSRIVNISLDQIAAGLRSLITTPVYQSEDIFIPSSDNVVPSPLQTSDFNWLQEELSVIHLGLGIKEEPERVTGRDFLMGKRISWFELSLHSDVDREKTRKLQEQVETDLKKRLTTRINLSHYPGAGGTTLALRIAWNLHRTFPTVILNHYSKETLSRLHLIFTLTAKPIFIIVESPEVQSDDVNALYSQVHSEKIPAVFLTIARKFESITETNRVLYLREQLDESEAHLFAKVYSKEAPNHQLELENLTNNEALARFRVPFFYGLTAFGEDFSQLESYVGNRLIDAEETERRIMCYLAVVYRYAHKSVPAQLFSKLTNTPSSKVVKLEKVLRPERQTLLVNETGEGWRPSHYLISVEISEQILSGNSTDRRNWKHSLSTWGIRLIEDLSRIHDGTQDKYSVYLLDLFKRLFIIRESEITYSSIGDRPYFARLIEDIPSTEGKMAVLEQLVQYYPEEPHFRAHLARLLSLRLGDHQRAVTEIERALEKNEKDDVLHHIKGMILRHWAHSLISKYEDIKKREGRFADEIAQEIDVLIEQAESAFTTARQIAPDNEYAYISHVQLLVRAVEFGSIRYGKKSMAEFLADVSYLQYQEMVERAERLLEDVKRLRIDKPSSNYVEYVETEVSYFYGNYTLILQRWNNFLNRKDIYAPPIRRRLTYAYLARRNRSWDEVSQSDLQKIANLMEDNIVDEPENDHNIRLWFNAVRRLPTLNIDLAIERLNYWYLRSRSLDSIYFLYVLYALKAIEGSDSAAVKASTLIKELTQRSRFLPYSHFSLDWVGKESGMARLVHFTKLGPFDETSDFFEHERFLTRVRGKISRIDKPEAGFIELKSGLKAFFVPVRRGTNTVQFGTQHLNMDVDFFLGFSYEGLRAWHVKLITKHSESSVSDSIKFGRGYIKVKKYDEAVAKFKEVLEQDSTSIEAWAGLLTAYELQGEYEEALKAATKITELQPQNIEGWNTLASLYLTLNNKAKAIEAYEQAIEVDPTNDLSNTLREKLKELAS